MISGHGASTSGVDIQPMKWWHIPQVHALETKAFHVDPWSEGQFWNELAQPTRYYVVAKMNGELCGYAGAFVLAPQSDLQTIAVDADFRGRGVGGALMSELLAHARMNMCSEMLLEVREDNESAQRLYEQHGFETIARRSRYYPDGSHALIMRTSLRGSSENRTDDD